MDDVIWWRKPNRRTNNDGSFRKCVSNCEHVFSHRQVSFALKFIQKRTTAIEKDNIQTKITMNNVAHTQHVSVNVWVRTRETQVNRVGQCVCNHEMMMQMNRKCMLVCDRVCLCVEKSIRKWTATTFRHTHTNKRSTASIENLFAT